MKIRAVIAKSAQVAKSVTDMTLQITANAVAVLGITACVNVNKF